MSIWNRFLDWLAPRCFFCNKRILPTSSMTHVGMEMEKWHMECWRRHLDQITPRKDKNGSPGDL